jgi:hypothetical protein
VRPQPRGQLAQDALHLARLGASSSRSRFISSMATGGSTKSVCAGRALVVHDAADLAAPSRRTGIT